MIPNDDLERISFALQKIQAAFDLASTALKDAAPDLRAFVFATVSADAAMRARQEHGEQEQQTRSVVSPRPNASQSAGIAPLRGKNENDSDSEDAPNQKTGADYVENAGNRSVFHKTVKDVSLKGAAGWCE